MLCICSGQITSNHFLILYTQLTNGFVNRTLHTTIIAMHRPTLTLLNFIPTHWVLLDLFLVSSFGRCTIFSYGDSTRVCYEIPCYFSLILSSFNFCDMCACVCVCVCCLSIRLFDMSPILCEIVSVGLFFSSLRFNIISIKNHSLKIHQKRARENACVACCCFYFTYYR